MASSTYGNVVGTSSDNEVEGARDDGTALTALLAMLDSLGIITDSTSAT